MWQDLQKDFLQLMKVSQNRAYLFFPFDHGTFDIIIDISIALASMLSHASICSMLDFQSSIFDSAIFILLFCTFDLH